MLTGKQTWVFDSKPYIIASAAVVGPDEGSGPLGEWFDVVHPDNTIGEKTWEKAERKIMEEAAALAVERAKLQTSDLDFYVGGDLMNQIISSSFAARTLSVPYFGVFGACSTSMESLALAGLFVDKKSAKRVMAGTCSHNSSVEKQFRYPTEYGSQKPPTAQSTVTGAGAAIVAAHGDSTMPRVTSATIGKVVDLGIKDPFNMGAAMAPAAADTIMAHFRDRGIDPGYYDLVITGDLARVGYPIALDLFQKQGFSLQNTTFQDCGVLIYDAERQGMQAGASGAGCSAAVAYSYILKRMKKGELKRVLIAATGALLSPLSYQQGESIPCICHAVSIEMG